MTQTIAISGKGGSGKTTIAAMMIKLLIEQATGPILAVDADPNSCLGLALGVEPIGTIADIREKAAGKEPSNVVTDRVRTFEYGIQQVVTESEGFDLITIGRPEGPGCYCAANNLLRKFLNDLRPNYSFVMMDNEAGMEHLSRRTADYIDLLCIIAEPNPIGVLTAKRIFELSKQLPIIVKKAGIIWNKCSDQAQNSELNNNEITVFGSVPYDRVIVDVAIEGKTVFDIEQDTPAFIAVGDIIEKNLNL